MSQSDFIVVWVVMGISTAVIDAVMAHRRYAGKLGRQVRDKYLHGAEVMGGRRKLFIIATVGDLFLWPLALGACLWAWHRDWQTCQAERSSN